MLPEAGKLPKGRNILSGYMFRWMERHFVTRA